MQLRKKRLFTITLFAFFGVCTALFALWANIPGQMHLIAGEEQGLSYGLPLSAEFYEENVGVLSVNDTAVEGNIHISLSEPVRIKAAEAGEREVTVSLFGTIPIKTVNVSVLPNVKIVPCGTPIGVTLTTPGVMVLGTGYVTGQDSTLYEPAKGILCSGDMILSINGEPITEKEDISRVVEKSNGNAITMTIRRGGEEKEVEVQPVLSQSGGGYKIGAWVRDSTQGIGTLTYYLPESGGFGALGHGVYDVDTKNLMEISSGEIYLSQITGVKKGTKGNPGELLGEIDKTESLGAIRVNTEYGLYGNIEEEDILPTEAVPIALKQDIVEGPAVIRTAFLDGTVKDYAIEIESVNHNSQTPDKGMVIRITDPDLLAQTGGIVQGMSGSPILQNGKLIGAVTHVFVQDPTKGYGIFIESMLSAGAA